LILSVSPWKGVFAMKIKFKINYIILLILLSWLPIAQVADAKPKTGFLVLAPDRGFLGNREVKKLFKSFSKDYPAALAFVEREYGGPDRTYEKFLKESLEELREKKLDRVVVISLFLTDLNPVVQDAHKLLRDYQSGFALEWAEPMIKSYLIAQILSDRILEISKDPAKERLVLMGIGPVDEASEKSLQEEFQALLVQVNKQFPFKDTEAVLYYNFLTAEKELRKKKNKEVDQVIIDVAAKKGDALLVPFVMGPKYSHRMSLVHWMNGKFGDYDIRVSMDEILPHPNVLKWMKKSANKYTPLEPGHVGVVIMPHGAQMPYNKATEAAIEPLKKKYRIELAYGMADPWTLAEAVEKLENDGARKIVVARMYSMDDQFKGKTDYILGLTDTEPKTRGGPLPPRVRSSAIFATFGGYEENNSLICEILKDRILEISRNPQRETVLLIAHGARDDKRDKKWINILQKHADYINKHTQDSFQDIIGLTVREDWPKKHKKAVEEIRKIIQDASSHGRTLIISNRLYGSGRYDEFFEGLNYEMNRKGLALHANMTRWLEEGISKTLQKEFSLAVKPNSKNSLVLEEVERQL
jgi:protoheme ferro-lyase